MGGARVARCVGVIGARGVRAGWLDGGGVEITFALPASPWQPSQHVRKHSCSPFSSIVFVPSRNVPTPEACYFRQNYESVRRMDETDFEGTLVLEQLAAVGKLEEFFDAVDSDDVQRATRLLKRANLDALTIATVIRKMAESDDEH
jgi:hypothetical protein